jgi:hypothetical protein
MQTPDSSSHISTDIQLGHFSDGNIAWVNLETSTPVFVTYPDKRLWREVLRSLGSTLHCRNDIHWLLCLDQQSLAALMGEAQSTSHITSFITDDPGAGTLINRKDFVKAMKKAAKKRTPGKKKTASHIVICLIDDIWELILKTDRPYAEHIAHILRNDQHHHLQKLAGSAAGNRALFPQLLKTHKSLHSDSKHVNPKKPPKAYPGTELILGTEGLIFRTSPGGHYWDKWYAPGDWVRSSGTQPEPAPSPVNTPAEYPDEPGKPTEELPENALLFILNL